MEELDNTIILNDEDGNEVRFELLDIITYKGSKYVVLLPMDEEDDVEVVILKLSEPEDDTEEFMSVDDDTLDAVFELFQKRTQTEFES